MSVVGKVLNAIILFKLGLQPNVEKTNIVKVKCTNNLPITMRDEILEEITSCVEQNNNSSDDEMCV